MKPKTPKQTNQKQTFITSGETAKILGLSTVTVQKLADEKQIMGWRTSGGHRRLHRQSVLDYLHKHPFPIAISDQPTEHCVLLITDDSKKLAAQQEGWLRIGHQEMIQITGSIMEAMLLLNQRTFGLLIIELDRSTAELELLIQDLVKSCTKQKLHLIITLFTSKQKVQLPNPSEHIRIHHISEKLKTSHLHALWIGSQMNRWI